jgi:hypothetical protein
MHTVSHRFANNNVDLGIELAPREGFNQTFLVVLFDDFSDHVDILLLLLAASVEHAIDFLAACFNSKEREETVHAFS